MLTNVELAILGMVAERPKHGYQLEQDIELRGMRNWTEIGFSSIYYVLNKLEKSGWLVSEAAFEPGTGGPARKVYRLTTSGKAALHEAVRERLAHPRARNGDFELALANLPVLSPAEARDALQEHQQELASRLVQVQAKWNSDRAFAQSGGIPFQPHVDALFDWSLAMIRAEKDWVDQYLSSGGSQNGSNGLEERS